MAKKSAPDPRFDPRFQRGYDGPQPEAPRTPAMPSPIEQRHSVIDQIDGIPLPVLAESSQGARPTISDPDVSPPDDADTAWVPPRRNPFALALLVGAAAMIAVGGWLVWTLATTPANTSTYSLDDQAVLLLQQQVAPALLICGTLGIVAWLMLGALAAAARRSG
jgi:hypothetical protein